MKPLDHPVCARGVLNDGIVNNSTVLGGQSLSVADRVLIRDFWNKFLAHDSMLSEMFFKRLLIEAPDLIDCFGASIENAQIEFLKLFDLAASGLCPATNATLREGYRSAPAAADAQSATVEDCGWFFAAHGMTSAHWRKAREVFIWLAPQAPYLEPYEREDVRKGEASSIWRFFTGAILEPMIDVIERATPAPTAAAELKRIADAIAASAGEAGAFFYATLFERQPQMVPLFGTSDMTSLSRHLIQSIAFLARSAADRDAGRRELQALAASHRIHEAPADAYPLLADPLIETLERFAGALSAEVESAWRILLRRASIVMAQPVIVQSRLTARAREFLEQVAAELEWPAEAFDRRWSQIAKEIRATGTYTQTTEELAYGAKLAWRNAPKCIGRIAWRNMTVRDRRHVTDPDEIFAECAEHLRLANNGGAIEIVMTVFAPMRPGERWGPRIWNSQLVRFAGYRAGDGAVLGDGANVALTEAVMALGWKPPARRTAFDVLPLVVDAPGHAPKLYEFDPADVLMVDIEHPTHPEVAALGLKWCAVPAIANFRLEIGGLNYGCLPFNGWFMGTEIARNLWEAGRYAQAEPLAHALSLDTSSEATLWRDRAFLELNVAVLHSFARAKVMLVDHHTASNQFIAHDLREKKAGRECPAQWSWIAPAAGGSTTAVWHHEMRDFNLRPTYVYAADRWAVTAGAIGAAASTAERPAPPATSPLILFASETGTAEAYARQVARRVGAHRPRVAAMDETDMDQLREARLVLVVASTFRDGEIPANGQRFMRLLAEQRPGALAHLRFAVLGIGNRIYPRFCAAAVAFDDAFARLGAARIAEIEKADELAGQADTVKGWGEMVSTILDAVAPDALARPRAPAPRAVSCPAAADPGPTPGPNEFWAEVVSNEEMLVDAEAGRSTRLITLDIGRGGRGYAAGDHVAIHPANPAALVEAVCRRFGFAPDEWVRIAHAADPRLHAPFPLRRALAHDVDLSFPRAPDELIAAMHDAAADEAERDRLGGWRDALGLPKEAPRRRALLDALANRYLTVLDILEDHPSCDLDLGALLDLAPRLKPRFYSIASSPRRDPGRLSILVGLVRTYADQGRSGVGVSSGYLSRVRPGEHLRIAISQPPRRLPDDFDGPLLLIGAGTGIAPLVGALEDRALRGAPASGRVALFFGCRDKGELLFGRRLAEWRDEGVLSRLGVAFSRQDGRRTYVQDLMDADAPSIWRMIAQDDARIMICGDARMSDAVCERLVDIAQRLGRMTPDGAEAWLASMRADGRLIEDVWGVNLNRPAAIRRIAEDRYSQGERWLQRLKRRLSLGRDREAAAQVR